MRERYQALPAWIVVASLNLLGMGFGLIFKRGDGTAPAIPLLIIVLALIVALALRGGDQGWGIAGILTVCNSAYLLLDPPDAVGYPLFLFISTGVTWVLYDHGESQRTRREAPT
jgi:hypothetical protein